MRIDGLPGTCSMGELNDVQTSDLRSAVYFLKELNRVVVSQNQPYSNPYLALIHNSTLDEIYRNVLSEAGFILLTTYKGDEGTVYVYLKTYEEEDAFIPGSPSYPEDEEEY